MIQNKRKASKIPCSVREIRPRCGVCGSSARLAEREGFEPSVPRKEDNGFRDRPDRPLRHLSIRTAARAYHGPPANIKRPKTRFGPNLDPSLAAPPPHRVEPHRQNLRERSPTILSVSSTMTSVIAMLT